MAQTLNWAHSIVDHPIFSAGQINKAPSTIKAQIKAASTAHPYQRPWASLTLGAIKVQTEPEWACMTMGNYKMWTDRFTADCATQDRVRQCSKVNEQCTWKSSQPHKIYYEIHLACNLIHAHIAEKHWNGTFVRYMECLGRVCCLSRLFYQYQKWEIVQI